VNRLYLCEDRFKRKALTIPGYSSLEIDFYSWIPNKFHREFPNHRLSLMKNLLTGKYELHRVYMGYSIKGLRGWGIDVTQRQGGFTEVAYQTENLQDALDFGNREINQFHPEPEGELGYDRMCLHVPPHVDIRCRHDSPF